MAQVTQEMAAEYERIRKRATEDPGTAGDEGEENWAGVLREWLPPKYTVVTKGRIINSEGQASGQLDILVLKDSYPPKLRDKKLYLAAGVAAAFECKTTLTAAHVRQAMKTGAEMKNLYPSREGTPYEELHSSVIYGLLAHSHEWKGPNSTPKENIDKALRESDKQYIHHPRDSLDILCVADLASWTISKSLFLKSSGGDFRRHTWSLAPSDPSHHEPTSGQLHPGHRTCHSPLYVLGKTTAASHPREGSLHYPTT